MCNIRDGFKQCIGWWNAIDDAVKVLREIDDNGLKRYIEFNGVILYSDTVTLDSAYKEITGKNCAEFKREREEYLENLKKADEEHKAKIPELTELYIQKGHEIIDHKYWDKWDDCVPFRLNDLYEGMELNCTLEIIKMLNDNRPFDEISKSLDNQGHSGMSYGLMKSMIVKFHDRGKEFVDTLS